MHKSVVKIILFNYINLPVISHFSLAIIQKNTLTANGGSNKSILPKRDIAAEIGCSAEFTRSRIIWNSTCWTRSRSAPKVCDVSKLKPGASATNHIVNKNE